jgi:hypothetical protein
MRIHKTITPLEILERIKVIGSFIGHYDNLSGTLEWYDEGRDVSIYATPNWETEGEVPFDVAINNDKVDSLGYEHIVTIKMVDGDVDEQYVHYINVLMMIMNNYKDLPKINNS